ncbi:hypothetical protein CCMA1212_001946 [Trichoderma ghanense]|uniref:Uncharacterized protein n=1 Tax=Trichoderma ghanense TaxID=65468 RepID=A0ABY2HE47_9HYPO
MARRVGAGAAGVGGVQNRVKHEVCEDWRWTPMVCEGTWRFLGCARWLMMESGEDTTDKIRRDGWCGSGAAGHSTFEHGSAHASGWGWGENFRIGLVAESVT